MPDKGRQSMRTRVVSIRLTEDEYERLDEIAIARRMTVTDMVRELIRQGTPEREVVDRLRRIEEALQEVKDMALDKGLRKTLYQAVRNGVAIEEMCRRLPGVRYQEVMESVRERMKERDG